MVDTVRHRVAVTAGLFVLAAVASCTGSPPASTPAPTPGVWRAWLDSPGGELPFGLELQLDPPRAFLLNGPERAAAELRVEGPSVMVAVPRYDSVIRAELDANGERLEGEWSRTAGAGRQSRLPFRATAGHSPRFDRGSESVASDNRVDGRWRVDFSSSEDPAVAIFASAVDGTLLGTFLTTTGDYRFLEGDFDGERLRLSCFDGAHAFLFDARLEANGSLTGDFWSRDTWHETWTAVRDDHFELPDLFEATRHKAGVDLAGLVYPDLDGRMRSLADAEFDGRVRIIEVFGSWCPNCNDAIANLVRLDREYREQGLSILGLAFELTGDRARDSEQVRRWAEFHDVEFPLLLAGVSDKDAASRAFPLIDRVRAYPTTIFMSEGQVRAIHQGFVGPAAGPDHERLETRFDELVQRLLAQAGVD